MREVAQAAIESNPNDFSNSDLGGVGLSSALHSQSDLMISSAVKLNMEKGKDFNSNQSGAALVTKKKKKKKSKKKKEVESE